MTPTEAISLSMTHLTPREFRAFMDSMDVFPVAGETVAEIVENLADEGWINLAWVEEMGGTMEPLRGAEGVGFATVAAVATMVALGADYEAEETWKLYHRIIGADDGMTD